MITPTPGYVLIEPLEKETKTTGGIYLPDNTGDKPQKGKVINIGGAVYRDGRYIESPVKNKEIVFYKKWSENQIKIEGKEYLFVKFEDVLGIEQ